MKFLWLFSIYLLCLAASPCHDGIECAEIKTEKASNHQKHASENEQCPPFCSCACCGMQITQVVIPVFFRESLPEPALTKEKILYRPEFPKDRENSIWQPPKLS